MTPKPKHLVYIPFTGVGIPGFKDQEWLKRRIAFFKKWTLVSLHKQTDKDFILWISWRPEEAKNRAVINLRSFIEETGIRCVFTFTGLMYHDDKYGGSVFRRVKNILRIVRYVCKTGEYKNIAQIRHIFNDKNKTLYLRLKSALYTLGLYISPEDRVLWTRIDSDDLFHHDAISLIKELALGFDGAVVCKNGYIFDTVSKDMAAWLPKTNPPFHTICFRHGEFMDAQAHLEKMARYTSHEDVPRIFETRSMPDGMYCVTTSHPKEHISTTFKHPFTGEMVDFNKLKDFV